MKPLERSAAAGGLALALLTFGAACACSQQATRGTRSAGAAAAVEEPYVVGTVLDAATGAPVAGAQVRGPAGKSARSDDRGRFRLGPFAPGTAGEVSVQAAGGRQARVPLRALGPGELEIVLRVARR